MSYQTKQKIKHNFFCTAIMIALGLSVVAADQIGQYMQEHRTGFVSH
jgi:hypothetical protein